jgi:hypothetical protein
MNQLCQTTFISHVNECKSAAQTYTLGTKVFGQIGYQESQNEYCVCLENEKVDQHYKQVLENFYQKYVPNKQIDTQKVLARYVTPTEKKYSNLYYDLHKKYDHAIGHVDGRKLKSNVPRPEL